MGALLAFALLQNAPALVEQLGADNPEARDAAQAALLKLGEPAIPALEVRRDDIDLEVRTRVQWLLLQLEATSALIDDLRADDVAGNAEAARKKLLPRLEGDPDGMLPRLTPLVAEEDVQAMFYATWLLLRTGHRKEAEAACPDLLAHAVRFYFSEEMDDMPWLAAQVVVRLSEGRPTAEIDRAYARAIAKIQPVSVLVPARHLWQTIGEVLPDADRAAFFPDTLVRAIALNLSQGTYWSDRDRAERLLQKIGDRARPALLNCLEDSDRSIRTETASLLVGLHVDPVPDAMIRPLIEGKNWEALRPLGRRAILELERAAARGDRFIRLGSLRLLMEIDPAADRSEHAEFLAEQLESDRFHDNAAQALELLVRSPAWATGALTDLLRSDDAQVAAAAWIGLVHRREAPPTVPDAVVAALEKLLRRAGGTIDEDDFTSELALDAGEKAAALLEQLSHCGYRRLEQRADAMRRASTHRFARDQ